MPNFNYLRYLTTSGFTLTEVLVTIFILATLTVVSVPNLRNFMADQELNNSADLLFQDIRRAQSSAMSGIRCPSATASDWNVELLQNQYQIYANCLNPDGTSAGSYTDTTLRYYSLANTPGIIKSSTSTCGSGALTLQFSGNRVQTKCGTGSGGFTPLTGSAAINLSKNGRTVSLNLDSGGVLRR